MLTKRKKTLSHVQATYFLQLNGLLEAFNNHRKINCIKYFFMLTSAANGNALKHVQAHRPMSHYPPAPSFIHNTRAVNGLVRPQALFRLPVCFSSS